jgi:hypothetical protein
MRDRYFRVYVEVYPIFLALFRVLASWAFDYHSISFIFLNCLNSLSGDYAALLDSNTELGTRRQTRWSQLRVCI